MGKHITDLGKHSLKSFVDRSLAVLLENLPLAFELVHIIIISYQPEARMIRQNINPK